MELREKVARVLIDYDLAEEADVMDYVDDVLAISEIAEGLKELAAKQRIETHLAGISDERKFVG